MLLKSEIDVKASRSEQGTNQLDAPPLTAPLGIGIGPIGPRFLARETWPLDTAEHLIQYHKFVQLMINRLRGGESNNAETNQFVDLIDFPHNWQYMVPALGMLPELNEPGHVESTLNTKQKERLERIANKPARQPKPRQNADAITADVREKVAKLLFGPKGESNASPSMQRLLTSWVELGYPGEALGHIIDRDSKRGRGMTRDCLGLPCGLRERRSGSRYSGQRAQKDLFSDNALRRSQPFLAVHSSSSGPAGFTKEVSPNPWRQMPSALSHQTLPIEPVRSTTKNSQGTYTPGDSDSPPTSDDPPEDMLREFDGSKPTATRASRDSFWNFVSTHSPDYREDIGPIPREPRGNIHVKRDQPAPVSSEVTEDGIVVVKGFAKQKPAISDTILKRIDRSAASAWAAYEEEIVANRRRRIEAVRERNKRAANSEENVESGCAIEDTTSESDEDIEIGKKVKTPSSDETPTAAPSDPATGPSALTISGSPETAKESSEARVNLEQVNRRLEKGG
ncbi:MAG: hypothetical protein Q9171_007404 [Xanthocarpia ochracea]